MKRNPPHVLAVVMFMCALGLVVMAPGADPRLRIGTFYAAMTALGMGFLWD